MITSKGKGKGFSFNFGSKRKEPLLGDAKGSRNTGNILLAVAVALLVGALLLVVYRSQTQETAPWDVNQGLLTGLLDPSIWLAALIAALLSCLIVLALGAACGMAGYQISAQENAIAALCNAAASIIACGYGDYLGSVGHIILHACAAATYLMFAYLVFTNWWGSDWPLVNAVSKVPLVLQLAVPISCRTAAGGCAGSSGIIIIGACFFVATFLFVAIGHLLGRQLSESLQSCKEGGLELDSRLTSAALLLCLAILELATFV